MTLMSDLDIDKIMELTVAERAYIAGFFDGEGHVGIRHQTLSKTSIVRVDIGQKRPAVLYWIAEYFPAKIHHDTKTDMYRWQISGSTPVKCFLRLVQPYLRVKLQEVDEALSFLKNRDNYSREEVDEIIKRMKSYRTPQLVDTNKLRDSA